MGLPPLLDMLILSVDFAKPFQFQMVQGTPILRQLYLYLRAIPRYVYRVPTEAKCLLETAPRERGQDITVEDGSGDAHGNSAPTTAACWLRDLPEPCVQTLILDELDRILIYLRYKYNKMVSKASNVRR
ncbi:MAG: hypothetical protein BYD32DRAFT_482213 [Podila humilis]|nr:MAG: hypothetical protein BYD32DRAFT_482213 [Podila humilis]